MTEYSVFTTNRFALGVDEDEDLHELLEKQQEEKKRKDELAAELAAKAKLAASKGKNDKRNPAKANVKRVAKPNDQSTTQQTTYSRNNENKPPRFAKQSRDGPSDNLNFEKPPPNSFDSQRRGNINNRGRGGPSRGFGRAKRDFDRHSGSDKTGIKAVEKREGGGPHNWGDSIQAQLDHTQDQQQEATNTENLENGEVNENAANDAGKEPVPEEPKEMTLDEWKKSQAKTTKTEFKVRKANEGTDTKQWKGSVALQKKKKGDSDEEEYEEESDEEQQVDATRATLEKLNIKITFDDSQRDGGSRGGRGGRGRGRDFGPSRGPPRAGGRGGNSRGGGGGGNSRGGGGFGKRDDGGDGNSNKKSSVPQVNNEMDFPSLGSR